MEGNPLLLFCYFANIFLTYKFFLYYQTNSSNFICLQMTNSNFNSIYEEYKKAVYNLSLNYVQNREDAEDITQEVFVKVYKNLHIYNNTTASLKTWIYRIAINQNLDFLKSRRTKKRFSFITSLFHPASGELVTEATHFNHPGIAVEDKAGLQALFILINELSANQKTALILHKIEDRPQKEVAEIMGISIKATESLLQRAKQTLSKKINQAEGF